MANHRPPGTSILIIRLWDGSHWRHLMVVCNLEPWHGRWYEYEIFIASCTDNIYDLENERWLLGDMIDHVGIYGSRVAEGLSASNVGLVCLPMWPSEIILCMHPANERRRYNVLCVSCRWSVVWPCCVVWALRGSVGMPAARPSRARCPPLLETCSSPQPSWHMQVGHRLE